LEPSDEIRRPVDGIGMKPLIGIVGAFAFRSQDLGEKKFDKTSIHWLM
jgi:hypothetical protein